MGKRRNPRISVNRKPPRASRPMRRKLRGVGRWNTKANVQIRHDAAIVLSAMASTPGLLTIEAMEALGVPRYIAKDKYQAFTVYGKTRGLVLAALAHSLEAGGTILQRAEAEAKILDGWTPP